MKKSTSKIAKEYAMIIIGTIMLTAGIHFFKIPNGFATGGVSGIGTILGRISDIFSASVWIMIINIFLLFVGFIFLGKTTGLRTVICSLLYSGLTVAFEKIFPMPHPLTDETFLELVYAMALTSIGSAIIFNNYASSGGTDIVALILKKYTNLNIGKALLAVDFLIALSSFFVFGVHAGLFSVLGLFAKAFLVDSVIDSINSCKYFVVITDKGQEINEYILSQLHHGTTYVESKGGFSDSNKTMIHTVCKRIEAIYLRRRIREIDPHSFVIITTTSEIVGRGFREC